MASYTNIIGKPLDLGDGNVVVVENIVIEAPSLRHSGTIVHIEGEVVSSNQSNQDVLNTIKKYATMPDLCYDSISFKNECFKNGIHTTGELYRNFQVTPERVIFTKDAPTKPLQGNATEATDVSYYSPVDEVINLIKAVFDDTRGESK